MRRHSRAWEIPLSTRIALPKRTALAKAASGGKGERVADAAGILLDQARILEDRPLPDPAALAKRLGEMMATAFG